MQQDVSSTQLHIPESWSPACARQPSAAPLWASGQQMFADIESASVQELEAQIGGLDPHETVEADEPLTHFLAWCMFVVQYKRNPLRKKWLLFSWLQSQCGRACHQRVNQQVCAWSLCTTSMVDEVLHGTHERGAQGILASARVPLPWARAGELVILLYGEQ